MESCIASSACGIMSASGTKFLFCVKCKDRLSDKEYFLTDFNSEESKIRFGKDRLQWAIQMRLLFIQIRLESNFDRSYPLTLGEDLRKGGEFYNFKI